MADLKISQLAALLGANVDPATDLFVIVDTSATETKSILPIELWAIPGAPPANPLVPNSQLSTNINVTGVTSETPIYTANLAANSWYVGKNVSINFAFKYNSLSPPNNEFTFRLYHNLDLLATITTTNQARTNTVLKIEALVNCQVVGSAGVGSLTAALSMLDSVFGSDTAGGALVLTDTTLANDLILTVQCATTDTNDNLELFYARSDFANSL